MTDDRSQHDLSPRSCITKGGRVPTGPSLGEYLIGVGGLGLLRLGYVGNESGRRALVGDLRRLLDELDGDPAFSAPLGEEYDLDAGYHRWATTYDRPLRLFPLEEPIMRALVDSLPPGSALDAACGTGRYATYLAERGHDVIGIDRSADTLEIARQKLPSAMFRQGELTALPLAQ